MTTPSSVQMALIGIKLDGCSNVVQKVARKESKLYDEHGLYNLSSILSNLADDCRKSASVLHTREKQAAMKAEPNTAFPACRCTWRIPVRDVESAADMAARHIEGGGTYLPGDEFGQLEVRSGMEYPHRPGCPQAERPCGCAWKSPERRPGEHMMRGDPRHPEHAEWHKEHPPI